MVTIVSVVLVKDVSFSKLNSSRADLLSYQETGVRV